MGVDYQNMIAGYVDFCFAYTVANGRANSYRAQFLGIAPSGFEPENGEAFTN